MTKPFRFGVSVRSTGSRAELVDKARKLEDLGYSVLAVPDHLTDLLAPMPTLVTAAAATQRLRVATMVLNNDFRHPVLVAREAATVDVLSDGRLELGLGGGNLKSDYDEPGLVFDPGVTRVERLGEAVVIAKRLLEGESVTFAGRHYRVTNHTIHPLPVQRPRPPIFIGGSAMGTDQMTLVYCEPYGDGRVLVRGFNPTATRGVFTLMPPTANAAVAKAAADNSVTQNVQWTVKAGKATCSVNGAEVASYATADIVGPGKLDSLDGVYGIRISHNVEAIVTGFGKQ